MSELRPIPGLGPGFYESGPEQPDDTTLTPKQLEEMAHQAVFWLRLCDLLEDPQTSVEFRTRENALGNGRQCRIIIDTTGKPTIFFNAESLGECLLQATAYMEKNK